MKRLLLLAFILVGCSGTTASASAPGGLGVRTASPGTPTVGPRATEAIVSDAPAAATDLGVTVTKRTTSAARNTTASVTIKTAKDAECGIEVQYGSGSSTAKGLEPKNADAKGVITWKWLVSRTTPKGKVPIAITCTLGDRLGTASTSFTVK